MGRLKCPKSIPLPFMASKSGLKTPSFVDLGDSISGMETSGQPHSVAVEGHKDNSLLGRWMQNNIRVWRVS